MFNNALEKVSASITNIIRITQITFEFVNNALLIFLDKKHFVDQAFKFPTTFLQYSELFSEVFVLLIVRVTQVFSNS